MNQISNQRNLSWLNPPVNLQVLVILAVFINCFINFIQFKELKQKQDQLVAEIYATLPLTQLSPELVSPELEKRRNAIEEAKWYPYLISVEQESSLLIYNNNLKVQKKIYWLLLGIGIILTISIIGALSAIHLSYRRYRELVDRDNQLRQSNQLLSQVNEQLRLFAANVSHELRGPLAAISNNAQIALFAAPDDVNETQQRLKKIVTITKSMGELIGNLLILAQQENIRELTNLQPVDLVTLLTQLTEEFSPKAAAHKLSLQSQLSNSPLVIQAEKHMLYQALANLLSNAIKYSSPGGKIILRLRPQAQVILIQVEDSGMGIPADSLHLIFEPFYRVDKVRSRKTGGLGISDRPTNYPGSWRRY